MAIGRISGSVLKANLTRNGTDLAFETNLLYLDVTNSYVGIGTSSPTTALDVNGTITGTTVTGGTGLSVGDIAAVASTNAITGVSSITLDNSTAPAANATLSNKKYVDDQIAAISTSGDITSVVAGAGLTGGATSGAATLDVVGGTGITANANDIAIDATVATLTGSQNLTNKTITSPIINTGVSGTAILDEDTLSSDSATQLATQQSIKAYADTKASAGDIVSLAIALG